MLQDLEAGKPLEYECMTGAVVELGRHVSASRSRTSHAVHASVAMLEHARFSSRVGLAGCDS